jgi:hypothetical protein
MQLVYLKKKRKCDILYRRWHNILNLNSCLKQNTVHLHCKEKSADTVYENICSRQTHVKQGKHLCARSRDFNLNVCFAVRFYESVTLTPPNAQWFINHELFNKSWPPCFGSIGPSSGH